MRRLICIGFLCLSAWRLCAQDDDLIRAALYLSGVSQAEEIDSSVLELLEASRGRKLRVNSPHLRGRGILSHYQVASIADYRARCGDILSWDELALLDGFSSEAVQALRPFLSLYSEQVPGSRPDSVRRRITGEALLRATLKNVGGKARVAGENWRTGGAWREKDWTAYAEGNYRGVRLLLGDYHLRMGQGLAQWSGFSMTSLSSADAFVRRPTGASPAWSYVSGNAHRGLVGEYGSRHIQALVFGALDGLTGVHASWLWRHGQAGGSVLCDASTGRWTFSADGLLNWRGTTLAFEGTYRNGSGGGLVSGDFRLGEKFRGVAQARVLPSAFSGKKNGEYALALGTVFQSSRRCSLAGMTGFGSSVPVHEASLTLDAALVPLPGKDPGRRQVRAWALWKWQMAPAWSLQLRLTERYRNYEHPRTDIRLQTGFGNGPWMASWRLEGVLCQHADSFWKPSEDASFPIGVLSYLEGGYKGGAFSCYLRATGFVIDAWNDRIYVYERDAPGSFSVPSYYGRGGAVSLFGGWKHRFGRVCTLKVYLRAGYMARIGRDSTPTLSVQLQCER